MNGYCKITMGQELVPLSFGFLSIKWFTEAVAANREYYYEGENLSFLGIAKLIHSAYKNNCVLMEKQAVKTLAEFNEWAEGTMDDADRAAELTEVLNVFAESRYTKLLVSQLEEEEAPKKKAAKKLLKK